MSGWGIIQSLMMMIYTCNIFVDLAQHELMEAENDRRSEALRNKVSTLRNVSSNLIIDALYLCFVSIYTLNTKGLWLF